ncbi:MAG: XTP/dITP diphosphatase [Candidatus Aminicenantes bacterium]|nr:XTP/dITP diphosphatase [Candidatus Aminicenantes bacterium]
MKSKSTKTELLIATTNPGKLREIKAALKDLPLKILSLKELGLTRQCQEKGNTFRENARAKAIFYSRLTNILTLAEDSGLEIEALNGAPGVRSARFAGPQANDEKNIAKVLSLLKNVPWPKRKARFICYLCLARKGKILKSFKGEVRGWIAEKKRGRRGFGYDPIFFYRPFKRTFGEITAKEKNQISHRGRALRQLRKWFEKRWG